MARLILRLALTFLVSAPFVAAQPPVGYREGSQQVEVNPLRHVFSPTSPRQQRDVRDQPPPLPPPQITTAAATNTPPATHSGQPAASAAPTVPGGAPIATPDLTTQASNTVTRELLAARTKEVQENSDLDEATKTELLKRYKAADDWLSTAKEAATKTAQYVADAQLAPEALRSTKAQLGQPVPEPQSNVLSDASLAQVEQRAGEADAALETARSVYEKYEEEIKRRSERKTELGKLTEDTKQRLEEAQKMSAVPPPTPESEVLTEARKFELASRLLALKSQLALYKSEVAKADAEAELLPLSRDLAKRQKTLCEKEVAVWRNVVADFRRRETERQAQEARRDLQNAHPALRDLAEQNAALAEQRTTLVEAIGKGARQLKAVNTKIDQLEEQFEKAEERVLKAGHSSTVGLMLRRQREDLPSELECRQSLREIQKQMPQANLALIEVDEAREALGDLESLIPQMLVSLDSTGTAKGITQLEPALREVLTSKVELLDSLATDYRTYLSDLSELELTNNRLAKQIEKSSDYIGEHVLWIRSTGPLWIDDAMNAARGTLTIARPEPWLQLARHCGLDMLRRPLTAVGVLLVVVLIVVFHTRLRAKIASLCATKTGSLGLRFRPTVEAIVIAAVVATEWPLLLAYLGWQMSSADGTQDLTLALGTALSYAAILLWTSDFVKQLLRPEGVAESHFGWAGFSTQLLRRELRWLTVLGVPLAIVVVGCDSFQDGVWADSLGRLAFIGAMILLANFTHSLLNSRENVLRQAIAQDSTKWFERLRVVSHLLGVGVPCGLAMLAAVGYYYSAQQVALRWQATLGISVALLLVYSIAARWCLVKRRNLAVQQARERQRQAAENAVDANKSVSMIAVEDQQPDLSAIHEQLRYLLRHAVTVAMIIAAWFVWADFLPALRVLDRVVLWEKMVEVVEFRENADNLLETFTEVRPVTTTLRHALFAGLLVVATFILGRNLPALLEVTVLQRMPFDKGGRHAISVLLKYALALTGVLLACRTLSITWSSVQWLAAGMTVGLGFGLQEIFANLVSGLILLFERPIRVGDIITLGDVTGTVTNMRIRATTVTNWDRKELIVPNKDLITGRLLNWTLSDTTNRIVIPVGVAYHSDPDQARELILKVLNDHSNVLDDPAPSVIFEEFSDSALNIVGRAFLSSLENRLNTIHELHSTIHRTLRDANIEIAFPQRDINVRGLEQLTLGRSRDTQRDAA